MRKTMFLAILTVFTVTVFAQSPTVSIISPNDNDNFTAPYNLTITADASDNGSVTKVEFYEGANLLGEDLTSPYSIDPDHGFKLVLGRSNNLFSNTLFSVNIKG